MRRLGRGLAGLMLALAGVGIAAAQEKKEEKPKTFWEEITWFAYVENSYVFNLRGNSDSTNNLRLYDFESGYTFNMAELSVKKEPSDRYPFGFGLVLTGGDDAQKNHAIGIFRDEDDVFPFDDTDKFDVQEAYLSVRLPLGSGLTVKGGKFVTLLGYEVIESPSNLNASRGLLFTLAIPLTHVGGLFSYGVTDWLSVTAGPVLGWDVADDNNSAPSGIGQIAVTPVKDLTTSLNFIIGPEKNDDDSDIRWVLDLVANYTGMKNTVLGFNLDYGHEENAGIGGGDAVWWGIAAYAAYDWTEWLRTALRLEYFADEDGARTGIDGLGVWEATATVQFKIWKGLVARLEYRHDDADKRAFKPKGGVFTQKQQDTFAISVYYTFF
jgi:Putative beta-barrel porin-2, OmpL-like. bbp2